MHSLFINLSLDCMFFCLKKLLCRWVTNQFHTVSHLHQKTEKTEQKPNFLAHVDCLWFLSHPVETPFKHHESFTTGSYSCRKLDKPECKFTKVLP